MSKGAFDAIHVAGGDTATPLSLEKRLRFISQVCDLAKVRFLDCGCGAGEYVFALIEKFQADAWGIEYLPEKVAKAKAHPGLAHRISQGDIQRLELRTESFDAVLLNEVLEHIPDEGAALRQVHRVLRPQGILIVFAPNRWFPFEAHGVHLKGTHISIRPWVPFIPYVPLFFGHRVFDYWARNYWQSELRRRITDAGFRITRLHYFWQTFENISGSQPWLVRRFKPALRRAANICESKVFLRRFGVSQVIVGTKSAT
jgi:SAM-dependent methyltransferase